MTYRCILADPPWPQPRMRRFKNPRHARPDDLPYPTMSVEEISSLQVGQHAASNAHLWLWTTNAFLRSAFDVLGAWGFRYLTCITWVKPSGLGAYFVSRTQHLLFGWRGKLKLQARFKPTVLFAAPRRHSEKPETSLKLIEQVSEGPRLELFARLQRPGWDCWGNEVSCDIRLRRAAP